MLPTEFQVIWPFGSGEEVKNRVSRWQPSWILDRNTFNYFCSTSHPDASYQVSSQLAFWFRRRREKQIFKIGHDGNLWFPIRMILAIFDQQVTMILPTKFQVNWPIGSGEEVKHRYSRWPPRQQSWISDPNNFSYFWSTSHPYASYHVLSQWAFPFWRRSKKYIVKMAAMLWLLILTILAIFDLQVILMLPTKFQVNRPFGLGDK